MQTWLPRLPQSRGTNFGDNTPLPAAVVRREASSLGRPNHERAHPDGHAVRKVRIALEHQVVRPSWFVRDANDSEIQAKASSTRCPLCAITGSRKRSLPIAREPFQDLQRMIRSLRCALFEVLGGETHCISDLCQAQDCRVALLGKRVEGCRLHFDGEYAFRTCCFNCFGRLPKRCIGRPTRTDMGGYSCLV